MTAASVVDPRIVLACLTLGVAIEAVALGLDWWRYESPWLRAVNVVVVFGIVFSAMSTALLGSPVWLRFAAGAAFGIAYEALNMSVLHAWSFPDDRLLILRGRLALVLGVGLSWGFLPVIAPILAGHVSAA